MSRRNPELWIPSTDHEYGNHVLKMFENVNPMFYSDFLDKIDIKHIEKYLREKKLNNIDDE